MGIANKLLGIGSGGGASTTYVEDVFSTYLYTGNGSTQTINNGIDLAGEGGMVWTKRRGSTSNNEIYNTSFGICKLHKTNTTDAISGDGSTGHDVSSFNSNGFSLGSDWYGGSNTNGNTYVSWTFRKAPKFFDVVTYTGDGVAGRQIHHNLGCEVGMIIVKCTSTSSDWAVYHRGQTSASYYTKLNLTNAQASDTTVWNGTAPTTTNFTVGTSALTNTNGATYVAYLFAHDATTDGIIQCGSFTTDASGNATVYLGWEPQYVMVKQSSGSNNWRIFDDKRGLTASGNGQYILYPNLSNAENTDTGYNEVRPSATGFTGIGLASQTYIYMAIRRSNKVPTSGSEVYNAIARTGTGAAATVTGVGFAPDLAISKGKDASLLPWDWQDRLRGATKYIKSNDTVVEATDSNSLTAFGMNGVTLGSDLSIGQWNYTGEPYAEWFFKRAKGFFDIVCYTGTGVARTVNHNLGVVPELMIGKDRKVAGSWLVYHKDIGATKALKLEQTATPTASTTYWNDTLPISTVFTVGTNATNTSGSGIVMYLFATLAGISKVGSYTGNGSSQTIACGFSTGARFILIKRTDSTGDWYVWDTARGIVAANDPHLSLNTTAAEVTTDDSVDPASEGFVCNQNTATNINVLNATYIFMAVS